VITYDMQWIMLIVDFFPQNLKAKAWHFLTTILKSSEKEIRSAFKSRKPVNANVLKVCHEKGMTNRQALLYLQCIAYNPIYEKCMSKLHDINAIYLILELLTGDRPGSHKGTSGILSIKYKDISIFEKDGLFAAHCTGQMKGDKNLLKKFMIPKELAQEILKLKRDHDGEENLFTKSTTCIKNKLKEYTLVCPSFDLCVVRKIAICALFFSKYLVLWKYSSSLIPRKSDIMLKYADSNNINNIFEEMLKDIAVGFGHASATQTIEYLALELVFEFFCLFYSEDKARHLLCFVMKGNKFERDPPHLFVGKGPEPYMYYNINIINSSLGHYINWEDFYISYFGVNSIEVSSHDHSINLLLCYNFLLFIVFDS
jgi:hypothetical protein